jgi:uncharacterized protein (TIGR02231 family)
LDSKITQVNYVETSIQTLEDNTHDGTRPENSEAMRKEEEDSRRHSEQQKIIWEQFRDLHQRIIEEIYVEASWGQGSLPKWKEKEESSRAQKDKAFHAHQESSQEYRRIQKRNRESNIFGQISLKERKAGTMDIEIFSSDTVETKIQITYIVPNACWRPAHRMEQLEESIRFDIGAMVWQRTGVSWEHVQLHFSTERNSLGTKTPSLLLDSLSIVDKEEHVSIEEREQEQHNVGGDTINMNSMPGINSGGRNRLLLATKKISIPSDGKPYFSHIEHFSSPMTQELLLIADQVPAVVIKTIQHNHANIPILPGPVELIKNQGAVGRAKVDFISPNESFEIGWGGHPGIRIHRSAKHTSKKGSFFSGGINDTHHISLYFSNIGDEKLRIRCIERIPVSELEQVEISPPKTDKISQNVENLSFDPKSGFIEWEQILPAEHQILHEYTYVMSKDSSVQD